MYSQGSNEPILVNSSMYRICKEAVLILYKIQFQHLFNKTEENDEKLQSGQCIGRDSNPEFPNTSHKLSVWTGIFSDARLRITEFRRQIVWYRNEETYLYFFFPRSVQCTTELVVLRVHEEVRRSAKDSWADITSYFL